MSRWNSLRAAAKPLLVTALAGATAVPLAVAVPPRPASPPPCSVDGQCQAKSDTYGFYQTRWRPFPGVNVGLAPTPAQQPTTEEEQDQRERQQRGPQLPEPKDEPSAGPRKTEPGAENGPPAAEGESGLAAPAAEGEPAPAEAPPAENLFDPAGRTLTIPPAPVAVADQLPEVQTASAVSVLPPIEFSTPAVAPSTEAETQQGYQTELANPVATVADPDAPPALPSTLQRLLNRQRGQGPRNAGQASPPARVRVDHGVRRTSSETPLGIQLVNPAAAYAPAAGEEGLQQAIYYEASDGAATAKPETFRR